MIKIIMVCLPMVYGPCFGQEFIKKAAPFGKDLIDTLFIDNNVNNWSLRAFGSYKDHNFILSNDDFLVRYTPNNRFGAGLGYANSKIKLDIGFNIKGQEEDITERFTFDTDLSLGKSFFGIRIAHYKGFDVESDDVAEPLNFRRDISTFNATLFYTVIPNHKKVSVASVISGSRKQIKNAGTFFAGGFAYYHKLDADSSILPVNIESGFNERADIKSMNSFAIGAIGGYAYNFIFLEHFFFNVSAYPGLALNFKKIETENLTYTPDNLIALSLGSRAGVGYNGDRIYTEFSIKYTFHHTSFNFGNRANWDANHMKLAFGWKLKARK